MPIARYGALADAQLLADLHKFQAIQMMQLEYTRAARMTRGEVFECVDHVDRQCGRVGRADTVVVERDLQAITTALDRMTLAHTVADDLMHRARDERKKMLAVVNQRLRTGELEIGLADKGVGCERFIVMAMQAMSMATQFLMEQREQGAGIRARRI